MGNVAYHSQTLKPFSCHTFAFLVITCLTVLLPVQSLALAPAQAASGFELTAEEKAWLRQHPEIQVGTMEAWAPFNFLNPYGEPTGIGADYIAALNKRLGGVLNIRPGIWKDIYNDVKEKRLDAILDITPKPEREADFNFTSPYLKVPHVIVAPKNSPFLHNEEDLKNKTVALERGFGNVRYFQEKYPHINIRLYADTGLALDAVARGEADAYAGNRSVALYIIGKEVMTSLRVHGRLSKEGSVLAIGVRKDWPILADILDRALTDISRDEIRRIQNRWVGDPDTFKQILLSPGEQAWINQNPKVRVAFDAHYPPYSFRNENGEFSGVAVDIVQELATRLGLELEIHPTGQWDQIYDAALQNNVDVIATMVKLAEREKHFNFTRPYISLTLFVITRKPQIEAFNEKSSLNGKKVALVKGYSTTELLLNEHSDIIPYYVEDTEAALHAVSVGKADATVSDLGISQHIIAMNGIANLGFATLYSRGTSKDRLAVRKDLPELASILDKALASLSYPEFLAFFSRWAVPYVDETLTDVSGKTLQLTPDEEAWLKQHPVIRLASDYFWPPFEMIDEQSNYQGIAADYMKLIEQRLGIEFIISPRKPWEEIVELVKNRELDLFSCAMQTAQRTEYANFTRPYVSNPMIIVTRDQIDYIEGVKGLAGKQVSIEKSYASYDLLSRNHPEIKLKPYQDSLSAMLAVSKGEAFAYVGNIATFSHVARQQGITNVKISGQIPYRFNLAMGARSDWPELVPILQKALDSITREEHNKISNKWIAIELEEPTDYSIAWKITGVATLIFIAFLYWNLSLNKKIQERTEQLAYRVNYDSLTGLPNRTLALQKLEDSIATAEQIKSKLAIMVFDLDDFRIINETMGHNAGDQLLSEAGKRISDSLPKQILFGRLGGDEFIVILNDIGNPNEASTLAETLLANFASPFVIEGHELKLSASLGIAIYPANGEDVAILLRNAEAAMYHSKSIGRNVRSFYTREMNQEVARRLQIEEHMHGALERGEFEVYYQPKIRISDRHIIGFEALLRWQNPALGAVSPAEFIPIAENNDQILPLGQFVLENALDMSAKWHRQYGQQYTMAVNLSPLQFRDPELLNYIANVIQRAGLTSESLELEITEGVLMVGHEYINLALKGLKALGVQIAMDDFGTGYSSLSYLRQYPFDCIKIDREFVREITSDAGDRQLVSTAIDMAHNLGLEVVAEGVETEEQLALLATLKCDVAQGFLFSKPLPANEISRMVAEHVATHINPDDIS